MKPPKELLTLHFYTVFKSIYICKMCVKIIQCPALLFKPFYAWVPRNFIICPSKRFSPSLGFFESMWKKNKTPIFEVETEKNINGSVYQRKFAERLSKSSLIQLIGYKTISEDAKTIMEYMEENFWRRGRDIFLKWKCKGGDVWKMYVFLTFCTFIVISKNFEHFQSLTKNMLREWRKFWRIFARN